METSALTPFDCQPRTRLVYGPDTLLQLGILAQSLQGKRALLVTDPGLVSAGHAPKAAQLLRDVGLTVSVFDRVRENPTTREVEECVAAAQAVRADLLVGLGGGSSMDTAKGCNFIFTNGGSMRDYWGMGKATQPMLPLIAIPTTAGTGSECQSAALIADAATHQKMACLDPKAAATVAILDPLLTLSQPRRVAALTGIDAIAHAIESAVTRKRTPLSLMYSVEAFRLCVTSLPRVLQTPSDLEARGRMLLGAAFAGFAIENSMLGATHSAANPLTAHFGVVHGEAVGLMMPHVIRFNAANPETLAGYAALASAPEIACASDGLDQATEALVQHLEALLNLAGVAPSLISLGVSLEDLPGLAEEAARQWTAQFNPRPLSPNDFLGLYRAALDPRAHADLER